MQISEGYAALHGLSEGSAETRRSKWRARVHPDDLLGVEECGAKRSTSASASMASVSDALSLGTRGAVDRVAQLHRVQPDGTPLRVLGVNIDITGRRRAEDHQRQLVAGARPSRQRRAGDSRGYRHPDTVEHWLACGLRGCGRPSHTIDGYHP